MNKKLLQRRNKLLSFLRETFLSEYGWHVAQVGEQAALASWIAGLPSSFGIEWRNHAILELGLKFGLLRETSSEHQKDYFLENWFKRVAIRTMALWRKFDAYNQEAA